MPYALLLRAGKGSPWSLASDMDKEGNYYDVVSEDKEFIRSKRNGRISFGVSAECLKVFEYVGDVGEAVEKLNGDDGA